MANIKSSRKLSTVILEQMADTVQRAFQTDRITHHSNDRHLCTCVWEHMDGGVMCV